MTNRYSSERWENARAAALARDNNTCQDCGTSDNLHVHHIRPIREFSDPQDAHFLNNLVTLCETCHPEWEGRREAPNLLDRETGLRLTDLVEDFTRDTLRRLMDPPGEWLLYRYFVEFVQQDRYVCEVCFSELDTPRASIDHCPACGRRAKFWSAYDSPPTTPEMKNRMEKLAATLRGRGIPVHEKAMKVAVEKLWTEDSHYGEVKQATRLAARVGIRKGHENDAVDLSYAERADIRSLI